MFTPSDFIDNYLTFENDFEILRSDDQSKVIFAPNGTGKSSIYKAMLKKESLEEECYFLDYEGMRDNFTKKKKKVTFGPNIREIENIDRGILALSTDFSPSKKISELGVTTIKAANSVFDGFSSIFKRDDLLLSMYKDDNLNHFIGLEDYKGFLLKHYKDLKEQSDLGRDIEYINDYRFINVYDELLKIIDNDNICPICDNRNDVSIASLIEEKIQTLTTLEESLVKDFIIEHHELSSENAKRILREISTVINENDIQKEDVITFAMLDNLGSESIDHLRDLNERLISFKNERNDIEIRLKDFYEKVSKKPGYKEHLVTIFKVKEENILFDDSKYQVTINLERNLDTYSTGELNTALFITSIFEFLQSDKDWIVLDDPISSFDLPNQYKIIFELVDLINNEGKKVIMFTHNLDVFNISKVENSCFRYYFIESTYRLHEDEVKSVLNIMPVAFEHNVSYKELLLRTENHDMKQYLDAIKTREDSPELAVLHKVFHFSGDFLEVVHPEDNDIILANRVLYDKIESVNTYGSLHNSNENFYHNAANKIIYLSALRVWVEKQLYDLVESEEVRDAFSNSKTIGHKIGLVIPDTSNDELISLKKILLSKKTMLNHNSHYFAQMAPFNYALNLSLKSVEDEILEIKNLFLDYYNRNGLA